MIEEAGYRSSHTTLGYGVRYNNNYSAGYYAALYRECEMPLIRNIFAELCRTRGSLLDFACGTGRITRLAPPFFDTVVGVDISEDMLRNAHIDESIRYLCRDITHEPLGEKFEVITAFRFFLNAEPSLRDEALNAICSHLEKDGRLICNIHMNASSIMGVFYRMARMLPRLPQHNTLSYSQFEELLGSHGLLIEAVHWYGATPRPGHFFSRFFDRWLGPLERALRKLGLQGRFSQNFLIVARAND